MGLWSNSSGLALHPRLVERRLSGMKSGWWLNLAVEAVQALFVATEMLAVEAVEAIVAP